MTEEGTNKVIKESLHEIVARLKTGTMKHGCGTPFIYAVNQAVEGFRNGQPVNEGITIDEVIMMVYDDWAFVGRMSNDTKDRDLYAPLVSIDGENKKERLGMDTDIEGFSPVRGHEYRLRVRRIYLSRDPFYHHYKLLEIISDCFIG